MRAKAFTLIELLIVVAIIAILAAIAVPNFLEAQTRAKVSRAKADMRTYATGLEAYFVDHNSYPPFFTISDLSSVLGAIGGGGGVNVGDLIRPLEQTLIPLSTPVAYLTDALLVEPFNSRQGSALYRGYDVIGAGGLPPPDAGRLQPIYGFISLPSDDLIAAVRVLLLFAINGLVPPPPLSALELDNILSRRWFLLSPGPDTFYSFDACIRSPSGSVLTCVIKQVGDAALVRFNGIYDPTNGTVSPGELIRTGVGIFEGQAR